MLSEWSYSKTLSNDVSIVTVKCEVDAFIDRSWRYWEKVQVFHLCVGCEAEPHLQSLQLGPNFRTLVRIRTFLTKLVRIWSGFLSKNRIFKKNYKITHENGFFWHGNGFFLHVLCESVMVNLKVKVRESLDSCTESGFLKEMVWIWSGFFKKSVWI